MNPIAGQCGLTPAWVRPVRRSRFTLVEMLVVIAIIGVLAALLMPALQNALDASRKASCTSNLRQLGMAVHVYADMYSGWGMGAYRGNSFILNYTGKGTEVYLGTLIIAGALNLPPDVGYCPSSQIAPGWRSASWGNPGSTQEELWDSGITPFVSYDSNPNICAYTTGAIDGYAATRKKLDRHRSTLAMLSDWHGMISSNAKYGGCPRNHGDAYIGYVRVDGSASAQADMTIAIAVETSGSSTGQRMEQLSKK